MILLVKNIHFKPCFDYFKDKILRPEGNIYITNGYIKPII